MNGMPQRLLDQVEGVDEHADAGEPPGLELREMSNADRDRLARFQRRQRVAHHRGGLVDAEHDGLAVEAVDAEILRDLAHDLEHRCLAAPRPEKREHVDRSVDRPVDVIVKQGREVFELAFVDRAMNRTRETPEAVLCHSCQSLIWSSTTAAVPQWT